MKRAILLVAMLAAGCTQKQPPQIQHVFVPTPVACIDPAAIPPEPPTVGQRFNGDAKHDLQILAPNARALREWGQNLRALLEACVLKEPGAEAADGDEAEPPAAD